MADGRVVIDTALNNKGFSKGISGLKNGMGGLKNILGQLAGMVGVAFGAAALVSFGKKAVELGSSVSEVQNVVDTAFGEMSYKIEDFAKTSILNFGMSRLAAKQTASTYMAMARGMGQEIGIASDKAIEMTGRLGDVASFYNKTQQEVDTIGRAVYSGETEPLKQIGIVMTQNNLELFAMSRGYRQLYKDMSAADQLLVRQEFFLNATNLAAGDFIKTQDSWANQTRILSMQWQEFMSIVGQALITVLKPVVKSLNEMVSSMIQAATAVNELMTALFGGEKAQGGITNGAQDTDTAIGDSVENQEDLTDAMKDTEKQQKKALAGFDEINKLAIEIADADTTIPGVGGGEKPDVPEEDTAQMEGMASRFQELFLSLKQGFAEISEFARSVWSAFSDSWAQSGQMVMSAARAALDGILGLIKSIADAFKKVWTIGTGVAILNTIHSIIKGIMSVVSALAERVREAWEASGNGVAIWRSVMNIVQLVLNFVDRVVAATVAWAKGLNLEPVVSAFRGLLEAVEPLVGLLLDGLYWAYINVLLPLATWVIEEAAPVAIDLLSAAIEALTPVIEALKPLGLWLWENFLQPLGEWTGGVIINAIKWLTERLREFSAWASENHEDISAMATAVATLLGAFVAYKVAAAIPTIITAIGSLVTIFGSFDAIIALINPKILVMSIALAGIFVLIMNITKAWGDMSSMERAAAVIGVLTIAVVGLAIAMGALNGIGGALIAAAGIAAGLAMAVSAVQSANKRASNTRGAVQSGFSAPSFSSYNVPHLARGAVIPPNREFLAVLGDQKSGRNIEAPESAIEEAVGRAMDRRGAFSSAEKVPTGDIVLTIDGAEFARITNPYAARESKRVGVRLVSGV